MALFAISDLHLSTGDGTDKSMEIFGSRWRDYTARLEKNWRAVVGASDTVVIPGDISWAISLPEAESDFRFLHSLPGKKILGKGNHDFWWSTAAKMNRFLSEHGFDDISFLHNNAVFCEGKILAGTRGWFQEGDEDHGDCEKLVHREAQRLELSLLDAQKKKAVNPEAEILVFLHFPPVWNGQECRPILDLLHANGIRHCYFGHIHGTYCVPSVISFEGMDLTLLSADYLTFLPKMLFASHNTETASLAPG